MPTFDISDANSFTHHLCRSSPVYNRRCQSPRLSSVLMDSTDTWYMDWVRTLLITPNRSSFLASSRAGVQGIHLQSGTARFTQVINSGLLATLQVYLTQGHSRNSRDPEVKGAHRRHPKGTQTGRFVEPIQGCW